MDSPSNFVQLPKHIFKVFGKLNISSYEMRVLMILWLKTYGWHKETDIISLTQWCEETDLDRRNVSVTLKKLISKNIIIKGKSRKDGTVYSYNAEFLEWNLKQKEAKEKKTPSLRY
jgi:phage replication O-like protein O